MSDIQLHTGNKTALLVGNTGLTGAFCQEYLIENTAYSKVVTFGRRNVNVKSEKHVHHLIDFRSLNNYRELFKGDDLYLCLGTTIDKAGSKEAFYAVDFEMNNEIARISAENDVKQLLLVSAVGADSDSIFFYNRVKGELEDAVKKMKFWAIHIFQPSILIGEREETRTLESIGQTLARGVDRLLGNWMSKYQPVEAKDLAKAMVAQAQRIKEGIHIYSSNEINKIAK